MSKNGGFECLNATGCVWVWVWGCERACVMVLWVFCVHLYGLRHLLLYFLLSIACACPLQSESWPTHTHTHIHTRIKMCKGPVIMLWGLSVVMEDEEGEWRGGHRGNAVGFPRRVRRPIFSAWARVGNWNNFWLQAVFHNTCDLRRRGGGCTSVCSCLFA